MNWRAVKAVVLRDLKISFRQKSNVFWLFIFPLILLSGYVALFAPPLPSSSPRTITINVAIVPGTEGLVPYAETIAGYMEKSFSDSSISIELNTTVTTDFQLALKSLKKGVFDAIVVLPEDTIEHPRIHVKIYVLTGTPETAKEQLVTTFLTSFFREASHYKTIGILYSFLNKTVPPQYRPLLVNISRGIWGQPNIEIKQVAPRGDGEEPNIRSLVVGWMTLSVIFMEYMFGGILGGASQVTAEIRRGFMYRLLSTKLRPLEYFTGLAFSWILILTLSTIPTLILGFGVYGGTLTLPLFSTEMLYVILLIVVTEILTFSVGVIIGFLTRSPEGASLLANIIIWATMIGGGFWLPKFMLPDYLKTFADINILSVLFYGVTEIAVYGRSITNYLIPVLSAATISILLFILASSIYLRYLPKLLEATEVS